MSDYITKEEVLNLLTPSDARICDSYIRLVKEEIKLRPTADVVEVVRCKDCKYWNDAGLCKKHSNPIVGAIYGTDADDYCSEGKRKDDEHK